MGTCTVDCSTNEAKIEIACVDLLILIDYW